MLSDLNVNLRVLGDIKMKDQHLDQASVIEFHHCFLLLMNDEGNALKKTRKIPTQKKRRKKKKLDRENIPLAFLPCDIFWSKITIIIIIK